MGTMASQYRIYMLSIISFMVGTSQFVIVGILDKVAASLGVTVELAGQLVTAFAVANAIGAPPLVMALAKRRSNVQLVVTLVCILVGIAVLLGTDSFAWIMISRALLGIGSGAFVAVSYIVAASLAGEKGRASAMAYISMGFSASLVLGVPLGRFLTAWYDWKFLFVLLGIGVLISIWPVYRWIPEGRERTVTSVSEQLQVLKEAPLRKALFLTAILFASFAVVNTYTIPLLQSLPMMDESMMSITLLALGMASLIGSKLGGIMADAWGAARTIYASIGIQVVGLALFSCLSWSLYGSIGVLLIWSMFAWVFGLAQSYQVSSISNKAPGVALSFNSAVVQVAFAIGAAAGGHIMSNGSLAYLVPTGSVLCAMAGLWAMIAYGYDKRGDTR